MLEVASEDAMNKKVRSAITEYLSVIPLDFEKSRLASARLNAIVREEIAKALQPGFNARIRKTPHNSYQQKKDLAYWVNCELRELGLAIRCPKTGQPSFLKASPGHDPKIGTFRLGHTDKEHIRHNTFASISMPDIALIPNNIELTRVRPGNSRYR